MAPYWASTRSYVLLGCRRSRVVTLTAIRLRGPGFKPQPGQTFESEYFCFRRTPAVVKACHSCRVRLIKTPLYKNLISYPILFKVLFIYWLANALYVHESPLRFQWFIKLFRQSWMIFEAKFMSSDLQFA